MSISSEWLRRINSWKDELQNHFYRVLGEVEVRAFKTMERLTLEEACQREAYLMKPGDPWGLKWEYCWFFATVTIPDGITDERIVLCMDVGHEGTLFIDGKVEGAFDNEHKYVTLEDAKPGKTYRIAIEAYGGHGPTPFSNGPGPRSRLSDLPEDVTQRKVGVSTFGIWEETAFQLWMDVQTLYELRGLMDENTSLRVTEIDKGLKDFSTIVDFQIPHDEMIESFKKARARLKPLMECVNGSTVPVMYAFGHSHLDLEWIWPLEETRRKMARTLGNQLRLMREYPDYLYLQSQAYIFNSVKHDYPELYERVKQAISDGKIIPEGGMWVEADTNLSGGESIIRQLIHGKRFFKDEFGVDSIMLWLPDAFGFTGALPQIMAGCGIRYFSTAKIMWNYDGGDKFPYNTFMWEGIDGTQILSHLYNEYSTTTNPERIMERWEERPQKDNIAERIYPFGHGDGGGGATRYHMEYINREKNLEGLPKMRMSHPLDIYRRIEEQGIPENKYVGELYYQCHRGTYTSQAKTKKGNRKSEFALHDAELWTSAANTLNGFEIPYNDLDAYWKKVLFNQFHDILPGSSITKVYCDAERTYNEIITYADALSEAAVNALTDENRDSITVFNSSSYKRKALVALPQEWSGAVSHSGEALDTQTTDGICYAEVSVPPMGWTTIAGSDGKTVNNTPFANTASHLENEYLSVSFNEYGEITSITDKETGMETAAGACNSLRMYRDNPMYFDAWDIESMYEQTPVPLTEKAEMELIDSGELISRIRVRRKINNSELTQIISLRRGERKLVFDTTVDWHESNKLLKVNFDTNIHSEQALHEIQFGYVSRPTHKNRQFDRDRYEVCCHKWSALAEQNRGAAILNDSKYGVNVSGGSINLSLLRSPTAPDLHADQGIQSFTYAFYVWNGSFSQSGITAEAYDINLPVKTERGAAGEASLFTADASNIVIETVKPAEDQSGDVIVRMYECMNARTSCTLSTMLPFETAYETNMLEQVKESADIFSKDGIKLMFKPFEIKTLRFSKRTESGEK